MAMEQVSERRAVESERAYYETWPKRVIDTLRVLNVRTWGDLAALSEAQLLTVHGFGRLSLSIVKTKLEGVGLTLSARQAVRMDWMVKPPPRHTPVAGVYFIRCQRFVKIGFAGDIHQRFRDISQSNPFDLELLAYVPITKREEARRLERSLHQQFKAFRHRLEWFALSPEVQAYIADLRALS